MILREGEFADMERPQVETFADAASKGIKKHPNVTCDIKPAGHGQLMTWAAVSKLVSEIIQLSNRDIITLRRFPGGNRETIKLRTKEEINVKEKYGISKTYTVEDGGLEWQVRIRGTEVRPDKDELMLRIIQPDEEVTDQILIDELNKYVDIIEVPTPELCPQEFEHLEGIGNGNVLVKVRYRHTAVPLRLRMRGHLTEIRVIGRRCHACTSRRHKVRDCPHMREALMAAGISVPLLQDQEEEGGETAESSPQF